MLRGVDVGCSPCRISRRLHGVSHVFSAYRRVQNPCKTMAATSVPRGMRSFWITHMRFRTATALAGTFWGRGGAAFHAESHLQAKWRGLGLCFALYIQSCGVLGPNNSASWLQKPVGAGTRMRKHAQALVRQLVRVGLSRPASLAFGCLGGGACYLLSVAIQHAVGGTALGAACLFPAALGEALKHLAFVFSDVGLKTCGDGGAFEISGLWL